MSSGIRDINLEEIICWPHAADFKTGSNNTAEWDEANNILH